MTTTTTTTPPVRAVASAEHARRQQERADTKTPLGQTPPAFETEELFSTPAPPLPAKAVEPPKTARSITLATTIGYRDYEVTITATGMLLDEFCDMLDKRLGVVNE